MNVARGNGNGKRHATQQSLNGAIKSICDIMRRSNCAGAMQYVPELTWILFLRILDEREQHEAEQSHAVGAEFTPSFSAPYRWPSPRVALPSECGTTICRTSKSARKRR